MLKEELHVIKQAIIHEVEGYEFYRLAAEQAKTEDSRKAFSELAKEELKHADYLKKLFDKIQEGEEDFTLAFLVDPPSPNIFNWEKVDGKYTSMAMSVFGIAIQLEKESIDFYKKAMEKSKIEEARKLYQLLIQWEKVHLDQFSKQYEMYKEEWWSVQEYAPF